MHRGKYYLPFKPKQSSYLLTTQPLHVMLLNRNCNSSFIYNLPEGMSKEFMSFLGTY